MGVLKNWFKDKDMMSQSMDQLDKLGMDKYGMDPKEAMKQTKKLAKHKIALTVIGLIAISSFAAIQHKDANVVKYLGHERLDGKTVIITGANTGIGKEAALNLAKRGAKIFMACRSLNKCEKARKEITKKSFNERVYCRECDLASMESIRTFVKKFVKEEGALHILINNAGVMGIPVHTTTKDGLEQHFGVNFFGHFMLTNLLLPKMISTGPSRVIIVTCHHHEKGEINFEDLNSTEQEYNHITAYNQSKLACSIFARELSKRAKEYCISVNAVNPGSSYTGLHRHMTYMTTPFVHRIVHPIMLILCKTPSQGAQSVLHCALHPDLKKLTGKYFDNCSQVEPAPQVFDEEVGKQLWEVSYKLMDPAPALKKHLLGRRKLRTDIF